jgi:small subunit ribosomal protein S9
VFIVNQKLVEEYFPRLGDREAILKPFEVTGQDGATFDVTVLVNGGGITGQTDAVTLGLARALVKLNPEFIPGLRKFGLLTRDPRIKERKKPGLKRLNSAYTNVQPSSDRNRYWNAGACAAVSVCACLVC